MADVAPFPNATYWQCDDGKSFITAGNLQQDSTIEIHWAGKNRQLIRQITTTGANSYLETSTDDLDLLNIPEKSMLFSRKTGTRLLDNCHTTAITSATHNEKATTP